VAFRTFQSDPQLTVAAERSTSVSASKRPTRKRTERAAKMISDNQLYSLAIFLGSAAMILIVLYHFLEVNSEEHVAAEKPKALAGKVKS
jgi:oligosaccharyl transferase complex subunit OST4